MTKCSNLRCSSGFLRVIFGCHLSYCMHCSHLLCGPFGYNYKNFDCFFYKKARNSIFLVEFSGNIGRNGFLTGIASQKIFRPHFQKSRLEYYFLCLFYFLSPFSGHFRSDFVVLLLLLTARSRRTRKADQKCPEKQDKKSKRDMKKYITFVQWKLHFVLNMV